MRQTRIRGGPPPRHLLRWLSAAMLCLYAGALGCSEDEGGADGIVNVEPDPNPDEVNNDPAPECGDGACEEGEEASCPEDCDTGPRCGDGTCDEGEDSENCSLDCPLPTDCESCADDQVCVTNDTVTEQCFDRDCPDAQCDAEQICFQGDCVSESCAGLDCGDYPNICRAGECVIGSCEDPDVRCPDGQECLDNECVTSCETQADCGVLACVGGFCVTCDVADDCGEGLVCVRDQCVVPCEEDPDRCIDDQVCNQDTGLCQEACEPGSCPDGRVCDPDSGLCIDGDCGEVVDVNDCPEGEVCRDNQCVPADPPLVTGMCSGCQIGMESPNYSAIGVLSPMDMIGEVCNSPNYVMQSGAISVTGARE